LRLFLSSLGPAGPNQAKREIDPVTFDDEVQGMELLSGGEQRLESVPPLPYEVRIDFIEKSLAFTSSSAPN
jgi:hypothetical protein